SAAVAPPSAARSTKSRVAGYSRSVGLEPADAQVVVVKSPNMFRAAYNPIAYDILMVDAPGASSPNLRHLPFRRLPHPLYPHEGRRKTVREAPRGWRDTAW